MYALIAALSMQAHAEETDAVPTETPQEGAAEDGTEPAKAEDAQTPGTTGDKWLDGQVDEAGDWVIDQEGPLMASLGKTWNLGNKPAPLEKLGDKWYLSTYSDLLTGADTKTLLLAAESKISGQGGGQVTPTLLFHCIGETPAIMVHVRYPPEVELIDFDFAYTSAWIAMGGGKLKKTMLQRSKDSQYLIFEKPKKWLKDLESNDEIRIRYTPFNHGPQVATFDLSEFNSAARPHLSCME